MKFLNMRITLEIQHEFTTIDAQLFSSSFEGVHGVVKKHTGSLLFLYFIGFL